MIQSKVQIIEVRIAINKGCDAVIVLGKTLSLNIGSQRVKLTFGSTPNSLPFHAAHRSARSVIKFCTESIFSEPPIEALSARSVILLE